jgi:ribonuclease-3
MTEDKSPLDRFQDTFSITFSDPSLLESALTHSSYAKLAIIKDTSDNERLEFFGDAVLKLIVSEYIFHQFPKLDEGALTQIRSNIISDKTLGQLAKGINLGQYMRFSHGESNAGGQDRESTLANAMEAILGAIYLDQGYEKAKAFFLPLVAGFDPTLLTENIKKDYKSILQEWAQKQKYTLPKYTVMKEEGPDHDKTFEMKVTVGGASQDLSAVGQGCSKKSAQQDAAKAFMDLVAS